MKVLLKRFHLGGDTTGFQPQAQRVELPSKKMVSRGSTAEEVSDGP